jgi:hypothetical protein
MSKVWVLGPNLVTTVSSISNIDYTISGSSVIHVTSATNPIPASMINLTSTDCWLYFDNIKPQVVNDKYLKQILINGSASVVGTNMRLERYVNGTVIISQSSTFTPLTVYSSASLAGTSKALGIYTYYRPFLLGSMNDNISSFVLKKGYMATFSADSLGTGYSRNYVASDANITINELPLGLKGKVSFVRVIPWHWTTKKGWNGGSTSTADVLNCSWVYDWNNEATSTLNDEYIPMRSTQWWNGYSNINNKVGSTCALGFNEPNATDQANMSVATAVACWPNLLQSGLRLGSPAPTDGGTGWLYSFIDSCDARNYRCDFVAIHFYRCGQTALTFYNFLKDIHDRTHRPIWITEWNNGANWTTCSDPTYETQAAFTAKAIHMLDTCSFVERYAIYEWVEEVRQIFYSGTSVLTPAGEVYRDKVSPVAYVPSQAYYPTFLDKIAPSVPVLTASSITTTGCTLSWTASTDNGNVTGYQVIKDGVVLTTTTTNSYAVTGLTTGTTYVFTIKAYDQAGNYSAASNAVSVTPAALLKGAKEEQIKEDGSASDRSVVIYPNPYTNKFVLKTTNVQLESVKIINTQGSVIRVLDDTQLNRDAIELGEDLSSGIYFIQITDGSSSKTYKVIKK